MSEGSSGSRLFNTHKNRQKRKRKDQHVQKKGPVVKVGVPTKYWFQRYRLFSRFDDGVLMDDESWYSVSPEVVAKHTAERCLTSLAKNHTSEEPLVVVDAFCGAGGNSIQFALAGAQVIAVDIDPTRIELAKHNAKIYEVDQYIEFIIGDFMEIAKELRNRVINLVFLSPPWGGPEYLEMDKYNLHDHMKPDGYEIFKASRALSKNVVYYLPRNVDKDQVLDLVQPGESVEIEFNHLNGKFKTISAYFGETIDTQNAQKCENNVIPAFE